MPWFLASIGEAKFLEMSLYIVNNLNIDEMWIVSKLQTFVCCFLLGLCVAHWSCEQVYMFPHDMRMIHESLQSIDPCQFPTWILMGALGGENKHFDV